MTTEITWQSELVRLLSSGRADDTDEAAELKDQHLPARLYKFFSPTDNSFSSIANDTVWLASADTFNDPFDSCIVMDNVALVAETLATMPSSTTDGLQAIEMTHAELANLLVGPKDEALISRIIAGAPEAQRVHIRWLIDTMPEILQDVANEHLVRPLEANLQQGTKISCFSEHATSMLLWSHYAAAHSGFCVEYRLDGVPPDLLQRRNLFPVFYSANRFDITQTFRALAGRGALPSHTLLAALHKAPEWSYEQEWRIVIADGKPGPGYSIPMTTPEVIHAGVRTSQDHLQRLSQICDTKGISCRRVTLSQERYEVRLDQAGK